MLAILFCLVIPIICVVILIEPASAGEWRDLLFLHWAGAWICSRAGFPHSADRSFHVGLSRSMSAIFFSRRHRFTCFSVLIADCTHVNRSLVHESMHFVIGGEATVYTAPVLAVSRFQIAGDSDLQRSRFAGEDVNAVAVFHRPIITDSPIEDRRRSHDGTAGPYTRTEVLGRDDNAFPIVRTKKPAIVCRLWYEL